MLKLRTQLREKYGPLYFLAALGAGGLSVSFFMYLMFMIPHPKTPIPTFENLMTLFQGENVYLQALAVFALSGIVFFALTHLYLLAWNLREYRLYRQTATFDSLKNSNAEVQLMAIPLTLAMTINVGFILGALFVPGLWNYVEYLFPAAIAAFAAVGLYGGKIFVHFMSRLLVTGQFDCSRNNSLSQMLAVFAFGMVGVGFSAPAAMSHTALTAGIALVLSLFFLTLAGILAILYLVLGFRSMLEHGIDREGSVSLWIMIPILTIGGIAAYRLLMGMHHNFGLAFVPVEGLFLFTVLVSVQLIYAVLGYVVMKRVGYFQTYIDGNGKSIGSYSLICPGVASFVMGFFFIHQGLVAAGLLEKFSVPYFVLLLPLIFIQFKTIWVFFRLNRKLLRPQPTLAPVTA